MTEYVMVSGTLFFKKKAAPEPHPDERPAMLTPCPLGLSHPKPDSVEKAVVEGLQAKVDSLEESVGDIEEILPDKQDALTAGDNISIEDNVISAIVPQPSMMSAVVEDVINPPVNTMTFDMASKIAVTPSHLADTGDTYANQYMLYEWCQGKLLTISDPNNYNRGIQEMKLEPKKPSTGVSAIYNVKATDKDAACTYVEGSGKYVKFIPSSGQHNWMLGGDLWVEDFLGWYKKDIVMPDSQEPATLWARIEIHWQDTNRANSSNVILPLPEKCECFLQAATTPTAADLTAIAAQTHELDRDPENRFTYKIFGIKMRT